MPWKEVNVMNQKIEFVLKSFEKYINFTELCREYCISPKIGYKWKQRFLAEGLSGLEDKPRKPLKNPRQISEAIICELIKIKKSRPTWGPKKIRLVFANNHPHEKIPSRSTVERILKKAGFVESKRRRRQRSSERIQQRIVPQKPNDLWTVDFKGWWYTPLKEKCEPLTVRDEFSKFILSIKILEKGNIFSVKQEFEAIFKRYGLPSMIRSDNGPPFASAKAILGLTRLAVWWMSLGIKLDRIDPASPYQNGGHERMHKDIKDELEGKIDGSLKLHQKVFDVWKDTFNKERPHESLKMKTPADVYLKSDRKYEGPIDEIEYPSGYICRRVNNRGWINYKGHRVFISNVFCGYCIGLKINQKTSASVWFDNNFIGEFDLHSYLFKSRLQS